MSGRRAAVGFIVVTLAIDAVGFGVVIPILPRLVSELSGVPVGGASLVNAGMVAIFAVGQLFAGPVLGSLSDRFGRRPVLLISLGGICLNYLLLAWAPSLVWLFVGRALAGVTSANISTANAYIADVSTPEERARRFGLIGASFSLGFIIGPAIGGVLAEIGLRVPFTLAAALAAINFAYGLFVLPESLPPERRGAFVWRGSNPIGSVRLLRTDPVTSRLAVAWACFWFALGALQSTFVYSTELRFGWGSTRNGIAFALVGLCGALVQAFVLRRVVTAFGERRAAMAGYAASASAHLLFAFAPIGAVFYLAIAVSSLGQIANPSVRAMLSVRAGPDRQGRMMGALSAVEALTAIVAPAVAGALFYLGSARNAWISFPGAPFLGSAIAYLIALRAIATIRPSAVARADRRAA